jgi:hypothetical protein
MVSDDCDCVVEPDDLAYALHRARRRIVHVFQAPAEHG